MNLRNSVLAFAALCVVGCTSQVSQESDTPTQTATPQQEQNDDLGNNSKVDNTKDAIAALQQESEVANEEEAKTKVASKNGGKVVKLTTDQFIKDIYDYKANPGTWVYKGKNHAVIDFYADWCGPCKRVAPIMDKLAKKYEGKIDFYKVNTDDESELSGGVFGIRSIPSILFIPANGQPMMYTGAFPEEQYIKIINENLLK